jgi:hypothetical protein
MEFGNSLMLASVVRYSNFHAGCRSIELARLSVKQGHKSGDEGGIISLMLGKISLGPATPHCGQ